MIFYLENPVSNITVQVIKIVIGITFAEKQYVLKLLK